MIAAAPAAIRRETNSAGRGPHDGAAVMSQLTADVLQKYKSHCHGMLRRVRHMRRICDGDANMAPGDKHTLRLCEERWQARLLACKNLLALRSVVTEWNGELL